MSADARALAVGDRVFIVGGVGPQDDPASSTVLVFDTHENRWSSIRELGPTYDTVAAGNAIVTAEAEPTTGQVLLQRVVDGTPLALPRPVTTSRPHALGLALLPESARLILTITDSELGTTSLLALDLASPGATWKGVSTAPAETFTSPVETESTFRGTLAVLSGDRLLSLTRSGLSVALPGRATRLSAALYKTWGYCGAQGASVWTGSAFLMWGGQSCSGGSAAETAQGLAIDVR
ncbi:MAG: hypothetical protein QOC82_2970 [Frankiaceae bacterium]|nr:hypothetical protein [Frankiaceae bacterium]